MSLLTMDEARDRLDPLTDKLLVGVHRTAMGTWTSFVRDQPALAAMLNATTRAGIIHDVIVNAARKVLHQVEGVREIEGAGFFVMAIKEDLLIRFKFVPRGLPSNVPTERQELLARQQFDEALMKVLTLEGMPSPPTLVTCGYTIGDDGDLGKVSLQCDYGKVIQWRYFVYGEAGGASGGSFETLPLSPTLSPDSVAIVSTRERERRQRADDETAK